MKREKEAVFFHVLRGEFSPWARVAFAWFLGGDKDSLDFVPKDVKGCFSGGKMKYKCVIYLAFYIFFGAGLTESRGDTISKFN